MSKAWRLLFDTIQYSLMSRVVYDAEGVASRQLVDTASHGLREAANVLIEAELHADQDVELMWRYWQDLAPYPGREHATLTKVHGHLTLLVLARLLSAASGDSGSALAPERASALLGRVSAMTDDQSFAELARSLMDSRRGGEVAEQLWDELSRRDMPERQVVFVQSLRSALARLLVLRIALSGRLRSTVGEWIVGLEPNEAARYWADAAKVAELAAVQLPASQELVLANVEELRRAGREIEAKRLASGELSQARIDNLQRAYRTRLLETRDVEALVLLAGGRVQRDAVPDQELTATVSRGFLVDGSNYVGEDTIGSGMAEQIARYEVEVVLRNWVTAGTPPDGRDILEAFEQFDSEAPALLVCPIDWLGDRWRETHLATRAPSLKQYTTPMLRDEVLLVAGSDQTWHIGPETTVPLVVVEVPLEAGATSADVRVTARYAPPRASGSVLARRFPLPWAETAYE